MSPTVLPIPGMWAPLKELAECIGHAVGGQVSKISDTDFLSSYSGGKLKRYKRAIEEFNRLGLLPFHAQVKMFVKPDSADPDGKGSYDPRAIQGRHPVYNYRLGLYLKSFEHAFINKQDWNELPGWSFPRGRLIAKGLNQTERGNLIAEKMDEFDDPVGVGADASRYDMHVSEDALRTEHAAYLAAFVMVLLSMDYEELVDLLEAQINNVGSSFNGVKYKVRGKRMSGDMNTGLGNSLLMLLLYVSFANALNQGWGGFKQAGLWDGKWNFVCDGDDSVFFTERYNLRAFSEGFPVWCSQLGFKMELEQPAYNIYDVEFCQGKPIRVGKDWVLVRNPRKTMSTSMAIKRTVRNNVELRKQMYCVGMCELSLNAGIPILQEYALALMRNGSKASERYLENFRTHTSWRYRTQIRDYDRAQPVSWQARLDFWGAFGVTPSEQMIIERELSVWDCSDPVWIKQAEPIDRGSGMINYTFV